MHDKKRPMASALAAIVLGLTTTLSQAASNTQEPRDVNAAVSETLSIRQQAIVPIVPIGAFAASGGIAKLNAALNQGLDAGLTVSDTKEVLVSLTPTQAFRAASMRWANS